MVTVAELGLAPGKSMRAYDDVQTLDIDHHGMFGDRGYMWVEADKHTREHYKPGVVDEPGTFLSQREDPRLTSIVPAATSSSFLLTWQYHDGLIVPRADDTAANRIPVSVWDWEGEAVDQGDAAANWGERYIGRPVRLVAVSHKKPRYVEEDPKLGRVGFADGYPITVGSTDSIKMINAYLESVGRPAVSSNRGRTTIILDGLESIEPGSFPEDYVESIKVASNGLTLVLRRIKACSRCPIPNTDQVTGVRKGYFLNALVKLGRTGRHADTERYGDRVKQFFTQNFYIELPQDMSEGQTISISRGDKVEVSYSDTTNWERVDAAA